MRTNIFVSRYYCRDTHRTTFVHKQYRDGWQYTTTVRAGDVRTLKLEK